MQDFLSSRSLSDVLQRHLEARGDMPTVSFWQRECQPPRRTIRIAAAPRQAVESGEA
jgi:hypothetical protein